MDLNYHNPQISFPHRESEVAVLTSYMKRLGSAGEVPMCITSYLSVQNAICHFIHQLCSLLSLECLNLCLPPMQAYWPSVTPQFCYFFLKVKISIKLLHSSL